jgi:PAS domain S-box-containing protein
MVYLRPHIYQTTWFFELSILGPIFAGDGAFLILNQRLRRRSQELAHLVEQQTRDLQLEDEERRLAEEELRRREAEYRRLVEDIPEVVCRTNEQGHVFFISQKIEKVFVYSQDEVYREGDRPWFIRMHEDDRERVRTEYAKLFRENHPFDVEYRIQHRDGHWMWWHDRAVRSEGSDKGLCADGLVSDITDRKQAEQELHEHREHLEEQVVKRTAELATAVQALEADISAREHVEDELRRSEIKFAKVFHASPGAMGISSLTTGRMIAVNDNFLRLFGFQPEEVIGRTSLELGIWNDVNDREKVINLLRQQSFLRSGEVKLRKKTGEVFDALFSFEAVTFGGEECLLAVTLDISEQRLLEERLRQAQKMEAIGTLSGGIAHDFNNLLTVIKGYSRMILDGELSDKQRNHVEHIDEAAERAASLTRQLLAFIRRQVLQPKVINLNALMMNLDSCYGA